MPSDHRVAPRPGRAGSVPTSAHRHPAGVEHRARRRRSGRTASAPSSPRPAARRSCTPRCRRPSPPRPRPARDGVRPGDVGDGVQHRHRPAGVDHLGPVACDRVGQRVGHPAGRAGRPVVGGHGDRADRSLARPARRTAGDPSPRRSRISTGEPARAARGQRDERRGAVPAADEHRRRPGPVGNGNGVPSGPTRSSRVARPALEQPPVPGPCAATTNWMVPREVAGAVAP